MLYDVTEDSAGDVGDYDQTSIRYTGRNIPSRSFRMLQHLTGSGDESTTPPPGIKMLHTFYVDVWQLCVAKLASL